MGAFQATAEDLRTTIASAVQALLDSENSRHKHFLANYEACKSLSGKSWDEETRRSAEHDVLEEKNRYQTAHKELTEKIELVNRAMKLATLDEALRSLYEHGLVNAINDGLKNLQMKIEARRKVSLNDIDMQAVLDRYEKFRQSGDDYQDVRAWLCIVAVNRWLTGEPVEGNERNEPEPPTDEKLTRKQEQAIRKVLKKAIKRIALDLENDLELNKKRKENNDKLRTTYLSQKITDTSIIERIDREHQNVNEQLNEIDESINTSIEDWKFISDILIPTLTNEPLSKTEVLLDSGVTQELRRGLGLLQIDFKKRRKDKPNIEEPEYIQKIIEDYKEYRFNESEYVDITYWLDIAETDKWLEAIEPALANNDKHNIDNNLPAFDYHDKTEEQEYFKKCRDEAFINLVDDIKEKLNIPENTFPKEYDKLINFINKYKRKATEHLVRKLTWWFFERDSTDKYGCKCNGIGTHEELTEFHIMYNEFTRTYLTQFVLTIRTEKFIKALHDEPPETAIITLEGLLNHNEKKDLHETHFGLLDYNADWRHYMMEILRKEIKFHERRIALEKKNLETSKKQEADNNEARLGIEEEFKKDTRSESVEDDSKNIIHSRESVFASLQQKRSWPQFVSHKDVIHEFIRISKQEAITETKALVEIFWGLYGDALQGQKSGLMQACYNTETFKKKMEASLNE